MIVIIRHCTDTLALEYIYWSTSSVVGMYWPFLHYVHDHMENF